MSAGGTLGHLTYEQLESYVDDRADEIDREIVDSHTELCPSCAASLRELTDFAAQLRAPAKIVSDRRTRPLPWLARWRWPMAAAAAACVMLVAGGSALLWRQQTGGPTTSVAVNRPIPAQPPLALPSLPPSASPSGGQQGDTPAAPGFRGTTASAVPGEAPQVLKDGERQITVERDGSVRGLEAWPVESQSVVRDTLQGRKTTLAPSGYLGWFTRIRMAQHQVPPSHLVLGCLYRQAGQWAEAEREFRALQAENPGSVLAGQLVADAQAKR